MFLGCPLHQDQLMLFILVQPCIVGHLLQMQFYLKAAKANKEVEKIAKYLAIVALLGHEQLSYWPSTIAAGLFILASLASNQDASCDRVMETHLRTKKDDLLGCMKSLEWLIKYAC